MIKNIIFFLVFIIIALVTVLFVFANQTKTSLDIFFYQFSNIPVGLLTIIILALGVALGLLLGGAWYQVAKLKIKKNLKQSA